MDKPEHTNSSHVLTVVQHNCVSNSCIFHTLFSELARSHPEVICIQDPLLFNDIPPAAPGFDVVFPPKGRKGKVRVATYISRNLSDTSFLPMFFDRDNIMANSLFFRGGPPDHQCLERLLVINVYNCKERSSHCITLDRIFHDVPQVPTLIVGDFNIHSPLTDPTRSFNKNEMGESLPFFQLASELGFSCINHPRVITRWAPEPDKQDSVIDLTFASLSLTPHEPSWSRADWHTGSDHTVCSTALMLDNPPEFIPRYNWVQTDWKAVHSKLSIL